MLRQIPYRRLQRERGQGGVCGVGGGWSSYERYNTNHR